MKKLLAIFLCFAAVLTFAANAELSNEISKETIEISGVVTDFNGNLLEGAVVHLKGENFKNLYTTHTDKTGRYSLVVKKRQYLTLYACRDYGVKFLEFWFWNFIADRNMKLDIQIDGLEVYGMKAWNPHSGAMVYFRPMSLKLAKKFKMINPKPKDIPIVPELSKDGIQAFIDNQPVDVLAIDQIKEQTHDNETIGGYLIQLTNPKPRTKQKICLVLTSKKTDEKGIGCLNFNGTHGQLWEQTK